MYCTGRIFVRELFSPRQSRRTVKDHKRRLYKCCIVYTTLIYQEDEEKRERNKSEELSA